VTHPANGRGGSTRPRWMSAVLCVALCFAGSKASLGLDVYSEVSVKAAYILRIAGYVDWPEDSVPANSFTIAVLGDSDLAVRLQALATNRTLLNRPVQVRIIAGLKDVGDSQILYIGADRRADLRTLLGLLAGRGALTISAEEDGLAAGSMINLLTADNRVRFEVSVNAAREAGLKISSDLLALAARVQK
jgi:YfiR/HmsC-like